MTAETLDIWNLLSCTELVMMLRIGAVIPRIHDRYNRLLDARDQIRREDKMERVARFSRSLPSIRKAIHEQLDKKTEVSHLRPKVRTRRIPATVRRLAGRAA